MVRKLTDLLGNQKYEILLAALIAHLYIGIFLSDLDFYTHIIWPLNMVILGFANIGVFIKTGKLKNVVQNILWIVAVLLPIGIILC